MSTTIIRPEEEKFSTSQSFDNNNITSMDDIEKSEKEESSSSNIGCCCWFQKEICGRDVTMFGLEDANGAIIDLHQSFCTGEFRCSWPWLVAKFVLWGVTVGTFVFMFFDYPFGNWFLVYVSYWTLMYSCVYTTLSLVLSVWQSPPLLVIRVTWVLYSVVAVHGLIVVLLYWTTEWGPDSTLMYRTIMVHGGTFALCVVDGLWINKIPVRLRHFVFVLALAALFVGWTILQAFLPVENRNPNGGDNLYNILNWTESPGEAAIVSVLVMFVAVPLCMIVFWWMSLSNRRYVIGDKEEARRSMKQDTAHVEEMDRMETAPAE